MIRRLLLLCLCAALLATGAAPLAVAQDQPPRELWDEFPLEPTATPTAGSASEARRMTPVDRFALETHDGPYSSWPLRSRLFADGEPTHVRVPGYVLLRQFELPDGHYLLATDYDCPYEEATNFVLLGPDLKVRSHRSVGAMYSTFQLKHLVWRDARHFTATFFGDLGCDVRIRSRGIPYVRPLLALGRVQRRAG